MSVCDGAAPLIDDMEGGRGKVMNKSSTNKQLAWNLNNSDSISGPGRDDPLFILIR